jgi:bifunctional UDP-N-acetylglucosamine pyrophosphorylase/glucosamine-1-phosphate N-acetyltransferase
MVDPDAVYVDTTVTVGRDVTLFPGTILQGSTVVGDECEVGPDTRLVDCTIGAGTRLERTTGRRAAVGERCVVGPYAVLEEGADVPSDTSTGAFYTAHSDL